MRVPSTLGLYARKLAQIARIRARAWRGIDQRVVHLEPTRDPVGRVLLSYVVDPYLAPGAPVSHHHTHDWESLAIGRAWLERGYALDVTSWANDRFAMPEGAPYDVVIDARYNLERWAPRLGPSTLRIFHADTAHGDVHNAAEARRLADLRERRGVILRPRRWMPPNRAIETAHAATVLGNQFALDTYRFAGKPLHRVRLSVPVVYPWPEGKDFAAARGSFLWFGSGGMVHKGLDLVLEAVAGAPDLTLHVCGPVTLEMDFVRAYRRELYDTPNIRMHGWIDVAAPAFTALADRVNGVIYASASECGGGCVITCMHAALLPIVTREASVDVPEGTGTVLAEATVAGIRAALRDLAERPATELRDRARRTWEHAREAHTRERFALDYQSAIERILGERPGVSSG